MKKISQYILLLFFLTSCSIGLLTTKHERKVERAKSKIQKLVKKYPELRLLSSDTVEIQDIRIDTLITKQVDTTVINKITKDTVTIETERAIVKYKIIKDSVWLNLDVKPDTIVKYDTVYRQVVNNQDIINTEKDCKACVEKYISWLLWIFVIIFVLIVLYRVIINSLNPL